MVKINAIADTALNPDELFVHEYLMIGTKYMPNRRLQIDRSLLEIYLQNIKNADVVQIANHDFGGSFETVLPYGRFFDGEIRDNGEFANLYGTRYMVSGLPTYIKAFTTDDINRMIDTGMLKDSSVSISWGLSQCSICGNDIRDYENCQHWPGRVYKVNDEELECYIIAKPAQPPKTDTSVMIENSDVVAGAYEDARVNPSKTFSTKGESPPPTGKTKLNNIADLKLMGDQSVFCCLSANSATFYVEGENTRDASELHQLYHMMYSEPELPEGWTMAKLTAKHKEVVKALFDEGCDHLMQDALDGALSADLKAKSTKGSENVVTEEEKLALESENATLKQSLTEKDAILLANKAEIERLTPLATLGEKYRTDVIDGALASGVRAFGNDFDEEKYGKMFSALSIDEIAEFASKWEASALAKLGTPKSKTEGAELELPGNEVKPAVDVSLYTVGR